MAANYNSMTDKQLVDELSLYGSDIEKRLCRYIDYLYNEVEYLQREIEEEDRWA